MPKHKKNDRPAVILGSSSPRRHDFLTQLGISFDTIAPDITETPKTNEAPRVYARRLAIDKASDVLAKLASATIAADLGDMDIDFSNCNEFLIIAADTIVILGKTFLQKPKSAAEAKKMLTALSGKTHQVISGVCVIKVESGVAVKERSLSVVTDVTFKKLIPAEITGYVKSGEPMDKAGAYAIQGIGSFLVKNIKGSYTNVVGLPIAELVDLLRKEFAFEVF